ncbi:FYVE and coiled-coil domain-containing protein 1 [Microcaecilia unicolor]|uniref:FYVE and coiled-coil domain-containing protein 1 n=1 Tax=Microcaecilia unicolor TaxID=1415580 RepID=A0A6P7Y7N3_9AMPH|nr:FYVE and coiled-coil domain-containing protein 1 [Microcaecilia unicolor]XP_030059142.1 FYVE and coiled-coil domain-containing protein 1 [Microcaecilia unicolor]
MMAASPGESQLQRIIRDLHDAVTELSSEFKETGEPITDDSNALQKFSYKLEYLLQFDQKEKFTLLGGRKDYWDYFCDCLAKVKGANDGIRFVKSVAELKTSLGKGRAFLRYSLVHQRLADTLQQCFMNNKVTSDWYYARSPFLKPKISSDIVGQLYELTEVQFDLASRGYDLDAAWPTFARRTLIASGSPAHMWKPPSRSSSMNSLVSGYLQAQEFSPSFDGNNSLQAEPLEGLDEMRFKLDESEIRQKEMQSQIELLEKANQELQSTLEIQKQQSQIDKQTSNSTMEENTRLTKMIEDLQKQYEISNSTHNTIQELQTCLQALELNTAKKQEDYQARVDQLESENTRYKLQLKPVTQELETTRTAIAIKDLDIDELKAKLASSEQKNLDLIAKIDTILNEKGEQTATRYESALKVHELLVKLHEAEEVQKEVETKLKDLGVASKEESIKLQERIATLEGEISQFQKDLTAGKREVAHLEEQLKDLSALSESLNKNLQEARREKEKLQEEFIGQKNAHDQQISALMEQVQLQEERLSHQNENVQNLEKLKSQLTNDREHLSSAAKDLEGRIRQQALEFNEVTDKMKKLQLENEDLRQTKKKLEEKHKELVESKENLEGELAKLRSSEKQLQSQIEDAMVSVDEKEKNLREENKKLDEDLQNAVRQMQMVKEALRALQEDYKDLKQREDDMRCSFATLEAEHKNTELHIAELEKSLSSINQNEDSLRREMSEKEVVLQEKESQRKQLLEELEECRKQIIVLEEDKEHMEKTSLNQTKIIESLTKQKDNLEKIQLDQTELQQQMEEMISRLSVAEKQREAHLAQVSTLESEVMELTAKLQQVTEEKDGIKGKLGSTKVVLSEHTSLVQQLKEQIETLNRSHVVDLVQCKEREEVLKKEKEEEILRRAELENSKSCLREELTKVKEYADTARLENMESKDLLNKANTDMAELGIQICAITADKKDAEQKLSQVTEQLQKAKRQLVKEREELRVDLATHKHENENLQEKLRELEESAATIPALQTKLSEAEKQAKSFQEVSEQEISALKFQLSTNVINYQNKLKAVTEESERASQKLEDERQKRTVVEEEVVELKISHSDLLEQLSKTTNQLANCESTLLKREEENVSLRGNLERTQTELTKANEQVREYQDKLTKAEIDRENNEQKLMANVDDLTRTKQFLEERLIELIRDKDALWQKSDALEFEQKVRAEERWLGDLEVNHCLDCQKPFSWMVRKHHCRLCGRIFCYYCCNNYVMTKHSSKKERCCQACFNKATSMVDSETETEAGKQPAQQSSDTPHTCDVTVTDEVSKTLEDTVYHIITDEELNEVQDSDSIQTESHTDDSPEHSTAELNSSFNSLFPDDSEDFQATQESEICLLKSGELTLRLPLTLEEILNFGDSNRELFIRSGSYSTICLTVAEVGITISWMFSSDTKSISFGVVYQESEDALLDQCKVLIPMTRCNSHKENIRGQLKVRNVGIYTLIFDNTFSRFISKKVFYHLTVEWPVVYDGSDLL